MFHVSYVPLHPGSTNRIAPRQNEYMQPGYLEKFDATTLISDAHVIEGGVEFNFPPPLNLEDDLRRSRIKIDGRDIGTFDNLRILDRSAYSVVDAEVSGGESLEISGSLGTYQTTVQPSGVNIFNNKSVLVTHQRDNDLAWIAYWILHHVELYGIDSVLIYDNGSTRYSIDELRQVVAAIPGIEEYAIVAWPIPFGPLGFKGNWDSDFGQHIYLRNSYSRFLRDAKYAFVCDVDELLVTHDPQVKLPDLFATNSTAILGFKRRQVVQVLAPGRTDQELRAHDVYGLVESDEAYLPIKYAYIPSVLESHPKHILKIHYPTGAPRNDVDTEVAYIRHFGGIRITWRSDWTRKATNVIAWPRTCNLDADFLRDVARLEASWSKLKKISDFE